MRIIQGILRIPFNWIKYLSIVKSIVLLFLYLSPINSFSQVISITGSVNLYIGSDAVIISDTLNNSSGIIQNDGQVFLDASFLNNGTAEGDGSYTIHGDWINTGLFNPGLGTVSLIGSSNQTITNSGTGSFYNLEVNNSSPFPAERINLLNDVEITNSIEFVQGFVGTGTNSLYLSNPVSSTLIYTSGRIIGRFKRQIGTGDNYLFPIGTDVTYNAVNVDPNVIAPGSITQGSVLAEFISEDPGDAVLPVQDDSVEIFDVYADGYWHLVADASLDIADFSLTLRGEGFPISIEDIVYVLKRDAPAGDWYVDGQHQRSLGILAFRNNLIGGIASTGNHFGLGTGRPRILVQPENDTVCDGDDALFGVRAVGPKPITYQWQLFNGTGWDDINDGGVYSGTEDDSLFISPASYPGMNGNQYRVLVTDRLGSQKISDTVLLVVQPRPIASVVPARDTICSGDFIEIDFSSNLPGTGYSFETITNSISGVRPNILPGNIIRDTLFNPGDVFDSVVYVVVPFGPGTLQCEGTTDTAVIYVNPIPRVEVTVVEDTICDGETSVIT
ncbi:MAG: hypothetical protein P1P82_10830, partial [Bacteroidales bacterium]|nr:hypothetical protein [Bacteroidales bacterium]